MKKLYLLLVIMVLVGIAIIVKPWQYSLSEQRVNQYLVEKSDSEKFNRSFSVSDLAEASIQLKDMTAEIGRKEPNKIQFNATALISIKSLIGNRESTLRFSILTEPRFDSQTKHIYINTLQILDAETESSTINTMMPAIKPLLANALEGYFQEHPIYQLNPNKGWQENLAYRFAKGITIVPGNIIISLLD